MADPGRAGGGTEVVLALPRRMREGRKPLGMERGGGEMGETAEARLKRMAMRSWRRGTKEMDLVLGPWSDAHLAGLDEARLQVYEALLAENDQDLMAWILGQAEPPAEIASLLGEIAAFARARLSAKG